MPVTKTKWRPFFKDLPYTTTIDFDQICLVILEQKMKT